MAEKLSTDKEIDRQLGFSNPNNIFVAVRTFEQSGDVKDIDLLCDNQDPYRYAHIARLAAKDLAKSPSSRAVFDMAAHRLATRDHTTYDPLPALFLYCCVCNAADDPINRIDLPLIEAAREKGADEFSLALLWATVTGKQHGRIFHHSGHLNENDMLTAGSQFTLTDQIIANNPLEEIILNLSNDDMLRLLMHYKNAYKTPTNLEWELGPLHGIVARAQPEIMRQFIDQLPTDQTGKPAIGWSYVVGATDEFDKDCLKHSAQVAQFESLLILDDLRDGKYRKETLDYCAAYEGYHMRYPLLFLYTHAPERLLKKLPEAIIQQGFLNTGTDNRNRYCQLAAENWEGIGKTIYMQPGVCQTSKPETPFTFDTTSFVNSSDEENRLKALLEGAMQCNTLHPELQEWIKGIIECTGGVESRLIEIVIQKYPQLLEDKLWGYLGSSRITERRLAISGLVSKKIADAPKKALSLINGKSDEKLGAIELLTQIGTCEAVATLTDMLNTKLPAKVRTTLLKSLESLGASPTVEEVEISPEQLIKSIESKAAKPLPKSTQQWLDISKLPALYDKNGTELSENFILSLINTQIKHKDISIAHDNLALLNHIDRDNSGDFALALLNQWLGSSKNASDKWAMAVAGMLGNLQILPVLTDPIQSWAEAARHKLAEYAAQAVALVPGNESLMLLDLLANRYRSRFRNIGKSCRAALENAAKNQNVSMDELADMIVPTLDFDNQYQRNLPDTTIKAVLQPDFKLTYFNPEAESETKAPPKSLPTSAMIDIKTVKSLIRQTVKGQTARLEQSLVRQRAWPTQRWQALFEVNPFLQSYASRLVWATLDSKGNQQKLFRRYPNGLLADATGDLVEFDNNDSEIVMVHPLNMDESAITAWLDHLKRMKIKPPFVQLERPLARLDPKHHNRKVIGHTNNHQMASGTFRSRSEKLGWARGSVIDGGGITAYFKTYPGALVSVFLMVEDTYIGQDPTDSLTLGSAMFVKGESVKTGSYVYDEPETSDDPRVIPFGDIPAVVYSETLADLKAIMA